MTTARQDNFNIRLAFNRGKIRHLMTGHSGRGMATIQWYILNERKAISAIDTACPDKGTAVSVNSSGKALGYGQTHGKKML